MPISFSGPGSKSFVRTIRSFSFSDDELYSANFTKHKTSHFTLALNLSEAEFEDRNVSEGVWLHGGRLQLDREIAKLLSTSF